MIVNQDVDGYTKTLNHRKILQKTRKNNNPLKTKRILKPKYNLSGGRFLHSACQGANRPSTPTPMSYATTPGRYWRVANIKKHIAATKAFALRHTEALHCGRKIKFVKSNRQADKNARHWTKAHKLFLHKTSNTVTK